MLELLPIVAPTIIFIFKRETHQYQRRNRRSIGQHCKPIGDQRETHGDSWVSFGHHHVGSGGDLRVFHHPAIYSRGRPMSQY